MNLLSQKFSLRNWKENLHSRFNFTLNLNSVHGCMGVNTDQQIQGREGSCLVSLGLADFHGVFHCWLTVVQNSYRQVKLKFRLPSQAFWFRFSPEKWSQICISAVSNCPDSMMYISKYKFKMGMWLSEILIQSVMTQVTIIYCTDRHQTILQVSVPVTQYHKYSHFWRL